MSDFDPGKTTGVREASPTSAFRLVDCFPPIDLVFLINNQQERAAIDVNRTWLSAEYLLMLASNGNGFDYVKRFDDTLPGWGSIKRNDQFYVGDFNADGLSDLHVFNGPDWSMPYLLMLASTGSDVRFVQRFDRDVPGWGEMRRNDRWFVADVNGDRRSDLYVYNALDWSTQYLGTLVSSGTSLNGGRQEDWIGSWSLGASDRLLVCNFNGGSGWDDVLIYNDDWFGLLRSLSNSVALTSIYPKWIHNHQFQVNGWW